jgi:molybdate transport repressor ModE-like protein
MPAVRWLAEDTAIDPRLLPLLRAVAKTGSLSRAVAALGLSYRHAWGLVGKMERTLGRSLVVMDRGRGARLSPFSMKLLEADDTAAKVLGRELAETVRALGRATPLTLEAPRGRALVIHASHDFALSRLRDRLLATGSPVELHFRGSLDCLADLARRECDIAGFHVPEAHIDSVVLAPYRPWLRSRGLRLIRFVSRRQGLMLARGNPKRVTGIADLARKSLRFVNRQPQSGTRLCLDRLLADAGVEPTNVRGYATEEFTHAAVAATVASGMADAGFGIEAAARQLGLDFLPLANEDYYLALRQNTLSRPGVVALLDVLRDREFRRQVESLGGYGTSDSGTIVQARQAFGAPRKA